MAILRTDVERALDELASQEEGMRFQGLAVVLGKKRWPELIARQRKKDFGLDAYAPASLAPGRIGKGLAASITATLKKISGDAETAKQNFPDLGTLLFVTSAKVGNADRKSWEEVIQQNFGIELHIIEREEIITQMVMPENASLRASFLHLDIDAEPQATNLIERTRRAAAAVAQTWAAKTKGQPLIDLAAVRLDQNGAESPEVLSLEQIDQALSQSRRIVLEGPAGRGKTTTLIQLAQCARATGTPFVVELSAWTSSRRSILEYLAGMPAFQVEGLKPADLARVQQTEPFLFLLNGWNEIAESNSAQARDALRELEREFPSAGIIVATRTHYLTPPLPGALRLRLLRIQRTQRAAYLAARLGTRSTELSARIDADPSLDELTRTPFILSEVTSLFEACFAIPSTKIGVLAQVLRLQEQREEHKNALHASPIFDRQSDFLKALATEMTRRGAVGLPEADARAISAVVARELVDLGQIEPVGSPVVLAALTSHHVLVRVDYPEPAFQFQHQQLQEYYAALDLRTRLLDLQSGDHEAISRLIADYANDPAWGEPLRMIAETFAEQSGGQVERNNTHAGSRLVTMALTVDPVFAAELAHLCGKAVWNEVREAVVARLRSLYTVCDGSFRPCAIAAMLATGAADFCDLIVPLFSGTDQQTRLRTYRLWPDIHLTSLGANWHEEASGWSEEARVDFVSELLHHRIDDEILAFAAGDQSVAVKKAAALGLMWNEANDALIRLLESMDEQTFEQVSRENADRMPAALRPKTVAGMRKFVDSTANHPARLRTALDLIDLGETTADLDCVIKDALAALSGSGMRNLGTHYIRPALEHLRKTDLAWVSEWVTAQVAPGFLNGDEYWLRFATSIPTDVIEKYLQRLETEDLRNDHFSGMISIISACADTKLAARVFKKLRGLRNQMDAQPDAGSEFESQIVRQLEALFLALPHDIAAAGVLSSIANHDALDIKLTARLFSRVARSEEEPLRIANADLVARLRAFLKSSVDVVLLQDDFNGEEKANLASSIAQVGESEDMADLVRLIRADIERVRRGRAARAAGDRGPLGNGGAMSYVGWHIAAARHLDLVDSSQVLVDLLPEPEYRCEAAAAMAREFVPKSEGLFDRTFHYDLIWATRKDRTSAPGDRQQRKRFAAAINAEIKRLREKNQDGNPSADLKQLAKALAAIDGQSFAPVVLDVIARPSQWDEYTCLDAAELLLMAGVVLPATAAFALVDSLRGRMGRWMQDSDRYLLCRSLALCLFIDDPVAGIAKIQEVLGHLRPWGSNLRGLVVALGESRSDSAVDLLHQLACDAPTFEQCEENFINAFASLDTPRARQLLLGFVDPDIRGIVLARRPRREEVLVGRLSELAKRSTEVTARLRSLCECDPAEFHRHVLSKVMGRLGTPEDLAANLNLIDDAKPSPVPQGIWDELESAFIEQRPHETTNVFTRHARASNELRARLFRMAIGDVKRRKSAFMLLGQIEEWRLEHGRPAGESRHPDLASGQSWPP